MDPTASEKQGVRSDIVREITEAKFEALENDLTQTACWNGEDSLALALWWPINSGKSTIQFNC